MSILRFQPWPAASLFSQLTEAPASTSMMPASGRDGPLPSTSLSMTMPT